MAKARAIIKRRKAVRNIAKITKTMNMIASSRFQRALKRAVAARPYTDKLKELLGELASAGTEYRHALMTPHAAEKKTLVFIVSSNRGLCGGYNAIVLREANAVIRAETAAGREVSCEIAGKRGLAWANFAGQKVRKGHTNFDDRPKFEDVEPVGKALMELFLTGAYDRVMLVYMRFISAGRQVPASLQLLPLPQTGAAAVPQGSASPAGAGAAGAAATTAGAAPGFKTNYAFLPDAVGLLDELVPQSILISLFQAFLDAAVSEQVARMVAMKSATDNALDLVKSLTQSYNRARQSQITTELAEIMGGAAALAG